MDSLEQARVLLASESFALVVLDPAMLQGDPAVLLRLMGKARLLIYSRELPDWPVGRNAYLANPATTARQLWSAVAGLLGISYFTHAGD